MLEQNRKGKRRSRGPGWETRSWDELTERYTTGRERREMTRSRTGDRGFERPSGTPEEYAGYDVLDPVGYKIGRAEKLFLNGNGGPEYVRVRIGFFSAKRVLIPVWDVAFDGAARSMTLK